MTATQKQIDYLLILVNRKQGTSYRYLSQARGELGLSSFQCQKLVKVTASRLIDQWK